MRTLDSARQLRRFGGIALMSAIMGVAAWTLLAETAPSAVALKVEIVSPKAEKKSTPASGGIDASNVAIWLAPIGVEIDPHAAPSPAHPMPQIAQTNKSFDPHVMVIQMGTAVQFPNKDPFLHNVFSLFDGKRFDLGFYEAGSSKTVHFDRAGISFLFCNIHPEMSAAVVVVDTPYFGMSDRAGRVNIPGVPDGRYQLNVWYERSLPADLKTLTRVVAISEATRSLETVRVTENPNFSLEHKNKYGQDYVPPANTSPIYKNP